MSILRGLDRLAQKDYSGVYEDCITDVKNRVNSPVAVFLLGVIAFDHQNFSKALELFAKAQNIDPYDAHYPAYLARTLSVMRRSNEARIAADTAAALSYNSAHLDDMLGVIYSRCGFHEVAIKHFTRATDKVRSEPNYYFNLAASRQFLGQFEGAKTAYKAALDLDPSHYRTWSAFISLSQQTVLENHLDSLRHRYDAVDEDADAKLHLGHAIAKSLEDLGEYEESLEWLLKAKEDKRAQFPFDRKSARALFDAATNTSIQIAAPAKFDQHTIPIFVVGLPRTGTTLVDRILSSHPQVVSAGELNCFSEQIKSLSQTPSPHVLDAQTFESIGDSDLPLAAKQYLEVTRLHAKGARFMVDKMPLNFFYSALIAKAFPAVKIIVLRRGGMDSCLSNFRQLFATQFSYYNYTFDLEDTAFFYTLFDNLMAQFRTHLPPDRFMEVAYEDIVYEQETQTRRLLEFCGLPWNASCLEFQHNAAPVSTASSVQVRRPIYSSSIGRWKKYGNKLDALLAALGELA